MLLHQVELIVAAVFAIVIGGFILVTAVRSLRITKQIDAWSDDISQVIPNPMVESKHSKRNGTGKHQAQSRA